MAHRSSCSCRRYHLSPHFAGHPHPPERASRFGCAGHPPERASQFGLSLRAQQALPKGRVWRGGACRVGVRSLSAKIVCSILCCAVCVTPIGSIKSAAEPKFVQDLVHAACGLEGFWWLCCLCLGDTAWKRRYKCREQFIRLDRSWAPCCKL